MPNRGRELWLAALAIFLITLMYLGVVTRFGSIPAAHGFFGHSLGIIGFLLMIMTETLYSLRKRSRVARWGRMANWLQFHIFTGLVGPFLVFLHTSWKFNGLAGIVFLLTIIIVSSGIIGRYIYTAVPRTADGTELQARQLGILINQIEEQIQAWMAAQPSTAQVLSQHQEMMESAQATGPAMVLGRFFSDLNYRLEWWRAKRRMDRKLRSQVTQLEKLVQQRRTLNRQMSSLATARRMLATWHAVHIPIGVALFTAALAHIVAAVYYATLIH